MQVADGAGMRGLGRLGLRILAVLSPLWAFGCLSGATNLPDLQFETGATPQQTPLFPTGADILVDVAGPARTPAGGSCNLLDPAYNQLALLGANCGADCSVQAAGEGTLPGSLRLRVRASTAGERMLEVEVADPEEGVREHELQLEFAEVAEVEVVRNPASDPGTTAPMLAGMEASWCVQAFASDERPLWLTRSENTLETLTAAFTITAPFGYLGRTCWTLGAVLPGEGHIRVSAAGRTLEYFPRAVADADIAEIHVHQLIWPSRLAEPVDVASSLDGFERAEVEFAPEVFRQDLIVRLVTTAGEVARGGAERFAVDGGVVALRGQGQVVSLTHWSDVPPGVTCLRAVIGAARIDVPVYAGVTPAGANPCEEAPEGGAGGAGGFGGEGG